MRISSIIIFHSSKLKMKSQFFHNVLCYISGKAAGEIWNWMTFGSEGFNCWRFFRPVYTSFNAVSWCHFAYKTLPAPMLRQEALLGSEDNDHILFGRVLLKGSRVPAAHARSNFQTDCEVPVNFSQYRQPITSVSLISGREDLGATSVES